MRKGKRECGKAQCDRRAKQGESREEVGGGDVGEMQVESKPPSSPDFSVKDTVLKR